MRPALAALIVLAVAGCAGTHTRMISEARAPVAVQDVRVYHARPEGAIDIAWLESRSGAGFGTQGQRDAALLRLRREAGKLGGNGVLVLGGDRMASPLGVGVGVGTYGRHVGASVGGGIPTTQDVVSGIAILVPDPPPEAPAE